MTNSTLMKTFAASSVIAAGLALGTGAPLAAPGTLSESPLFLSTSVEPNVYFILDDSGSMEWDLLVAGTTSGLPNIGGWSGNYYILPTPNNGLDIDFINSGCTPTCYPYVTPSATAEPGAWRARNFEFNSLYYNPAVTYSPWPGVDASGNPLYNDSTPTAAPVDPNDPGGATLDLTSPISFFNYAPSQGGWFVDTIFPAEYYLWSDTNGNGIVDATDGNVQVRITPSTSTYTVSATRADCVAAPVCTYNEEIQNFANWFTYHRKRKFIAKSALGTVVSDTTNKRMGLDVYNNGNIRDAASMSVQSNQVSLLQSIYGQNIRCDSVICFGTPARRALQRVGDLFRSGSSPILPASQGGTCQQNFDVVITDGYWNGGNPGVGNTDGDDNTAFDGPPYADGNANTLADVAMEYYENDLKTSLADQVPKIGGIDEAQHQHLVTFGVALGITGTLDPGVSDPTSAGFNWPNPIPTQDGRRIDDLWHAAYNSRGLFLNAQDPQQLTLGLQAALSAIASRTGSASAVALNSTSLNTNSVLYFARFSSDKWEGDLQSVDLDPVTGAIQPTINWSAANALDSRDLLTTPRTILSYDGTDGIPFQWSALTAAQQADLRTDPTGSTDTPASGLARMDFLRGDRGCEINSTMSCSYTDGTNTFTSKSLRTRGSRLGDIVHSDPVYVGPPRGNWPDTAPFPTSAGQTYSDFVASQKNRAGVVYVGSNDGMLHGFSETNGQEVMAYIPSMLFSTSATGGLHYLTDPAYTHRYYVDAPPTVTDAYVKTTVSGSRAWRTILLGGLRAGGRGMYALDVTSPIYSESGSDPQDKVLWEFTHPDLGYTFSQASIVLMNNGKWAAIFGNGYNDTGSGEAKLFILFLEDGLDGTWSATDYVVISTQTGSPANRNGLSTPAVIDSDGNGTADRVYAGDLQGDLWVFDLSSSNSNAWDVATKSGTTPVPLFDGSPSQPITTVPMVVDNTAVPTSATNSPNELVLFGTGQYLTTSDISSTTVQAFYGVWNKGSGNVTVSDLVTQTLSASATSPDFRLVTNNPVDYTGTDLGWRIEFSDIAGERVVTDPVVRDDLVFFNTTVPNSSPCTGGGTGYLMSINWLDGNSPSEPAFDINGDNRVDSLDMVSDGSNMVTAGGRRFNGGLPTSPVIMGNRRYVSGSDTGSASGTFNDQLVDRKGQKTGRLSWEELKL